MKERRADRKKAQRMARRCIENMSREASLQESLDRQTRLNAASTEEEQNELLGRVMEARRRRPKNWRILPGGLA